MTCSCTMFNVCSCFAGCWCVAGKLGGAYIPPFKLARMLAEVDDKSSPQYQRMTWDALRKSINGLINKVNAPNIKNLLPELFAENLIRGKGLFCQSMMKAQMASPPFTPVYAALVAVVNTKFPELGELLLHRVIAQFKRAYRHNDKPICIAVTKFIAHLINQGVVHEVRLLDSSTAVSPTAAHLSALHCTGFTILYCSCHVGIHSTSCLVNSGMTTSCVQLPCTASGPPESMLLLLLLYFYLCSCLICVDFIV